MITRNKVLSQAVDQCMKELYSYVQPHVSWEDFIAENKLYNKAYQEWEAFNRAKHRKDENPEKWEEIRKKYESLNWENKSITECIGPRPFEFYYLPSDVLKDIIINYVEAYQFDSQQNLLNIIEILKNYCREPIVDKWIEGEGDNPGHRGYEHPDNLEKEIQKYLQEHYDLYDSEDNENDSKELQNKFFEFLDMAGNFYNWNRDLNTFNMNVYLGASPNSNKEKVIENWKKYRCKDIEIDEEQIKKDYYGEDFECE